MISIYKHFTFDAAHALEGYDGKCKNIHGHTYHLEIGLTGEPIADKENPKYGMIMDFGDLKALVKEHVLNLFDHRLIVSKDSRFAYLSKEDATVRLVDYQPTCELMLMEIVAILKSLFGAEVVLESVSLRETPTSYAMWRL